MPDQPGPVRVLFMQSQEYFGADSRIHALAMAHLDPDRVEVHVACAVGRHAASPALEAIGRIDGIAVRPTDFGPTAHGRSRAAVVRDVLRSGPRAVADLVRLVRYARRHRIEVVHGTEKPRDAFYGLVVARAAGARAVTHLHVQAEDWISPLSRWAMARADALIGISDFVTASFADIGLAEVPARTVHNALDVAAWPPSGPGAAVPSGPRRDEDVPVVVSASRLFPWKGQELLLDALARVHAAGHPFHLLVVGEDDPRATPGGGSHRATLEQRVAALGLDDVVTFTGFRDDVQELMRAADVFAMPSFAEPFGVVYLEAMATGLPVVSLDTGGTPEVVEHGSTGLLSPRGDVDALAANLVRLLTDEALRRAMGAAGRRRLEERFTPGHLAADLERLYLDLARRPRGAAGGTSGELGGDVEVGTLAAAGPAADGGAGVGAGVGEPA